MGADGTVLASADGGATWAARNPATSSFLYGIACATSATCIAVSDGDAIIETSDGGTTWTSRSSGTYHGLSGVACPTSTYCLAVGADGTILTSTGG